MGKSKLYIPTGRKRLRRGYTTGIYVAAVAAGATALLLGEAALLAMHIDILVGVRVEVELLEHAAGGGWTTCAIHKDDSDDPNVTDGALIYTWVGRGTGSGIAINDGQGMDRMTRPGLDQPVGETVVDSTPHRMIREQLEATAAQVGYAGGLQAMIPVPIGEALMGRIFNPRLSTEGGISILDTSGVIHPMSEAALLGPLYLEMDQQRATGAWGIVITPGNYGGTFAWEELGLSLARWCAYSNYTDAAIDHAVGAGFRLVLLVGHLGKLIKTSIGCMNTYFKVAGTRRETLAAHVVLAGGDRALVKVLFDSPITGAGVGLLEGVSLLEPAMDSIAGKLDAQPKRRAGSELAIEGIFLSNQHGTLGEIPGAEVLLAPHRA